MKKSIIIGLVTAGSIVTIGAATGIGVSMALKKHKSTTDDQPKDKPTFTEIVKEGIHELVHGAPHQQLSTTQLVDAIKAGAVMPSEIYDIMDENGHKIDEIKGPDLNTYFDQTAKMFGTKPLSSVIHDIDGFNRKAYYYAKNGDATNSNENVRINFFMGYLLHNSYFLPSNIQIKSVSEPHTLTHNVTATFQDVNTGQTDHITVDYNQEDTADAARLKNEHGWFVGGVMDVGSEMFHGIASRVGFVKSWFEDHNMGWVSKLVPFLATRTIAHAILSGISFVVGGPVIVPLIPLWGAAYLIYKGVQTFGGALF